MENVREKIEKEGINEFINSLFEKYKPTNTNELFNVFKDMADPLANDLNEAIDNDWKGTNDKIKRHMYISIGMTLMPIVCKSQILIGITIAILVINLCFGIRLYFNTKKRVVYFQANAHNIAMLNLNSILNKFIYENVNLQPDEEVSDEVFDKYFGKNSCEEFIDICSNYFLNSIGWEK